MYEKKITVLVERGVHGRVATRLAQIAQQYDVRLCILDKGNEIDCTSVLDVLSMAFVHGSRIKFRAHGESSTEAIAAVEELFAINDEP